jgi:hypothetical protein
VRLKVWEARCCFYRLKLLFFLLPSFHSCLKPLLRFQVRVVWHRLFLRFSSLVSIRSLRISKWISHEINEIRRTSSLLSHICVKFPWLQDFRAAAHWCLRGTHLVAFNFHSLLVGSGFHSRSFSIFLVTIQWYLAWSQVMDGFINQGIIWWSLVEAHVTRSLTRNSLLKHYLMSGRFLW